MIRKERSTDVHKLEPDIEPPMFGLVLAEAGCRVSLGVWGRVAQDLRNISSQTQEARQCIGSDRKEPL